jgi:hypothetical protein
MIPFLPIFLSGVGSSLELWPLPQSRIVTRMHPQLTDAQRLASDWQRVGHALYSAIEKVNLDAGKEEQDPVTSADRT